MCFWTNSFRELVKSKESWDAEVMCEQVVTVFGLLTFKYLQRICWERLFSSNILLHLQTAPPGSWPVQSQLLLLSSEQFRAGEASSVAQGNISSTVQERLCSLPWLYYIISIYPGILTQGRLQQWQLNVLCLIFDWTPMQTPWCSFFNIYYSYIFYINSGLLLLCMLFPSSGPFASLLCNMYISALGSIKSFFILEDET